MVSLGSVRLLPIADTPFPAHSPNPLTLPEGATPRRREKAGWLAPVNLFPPALRGIGRERRKVHDRAKPKRAPCAPLCYCAGAHAARTPLFTATGRHSVQACKRLFALRAKRRLQAFSPCPPSALSGWGQGYAPPPHYLSAAATSSAYQRTLNTHRSLRGVAPPAPPLLRGVCSASGFAASSGLPPAECQQSPVALSLPPPSNPPPPPPVPPSHSPRGDNNRLGPFLSAGASHCGARLRPRPPL